MTGSVDANLHRDIGRLEGQVRALEGQVSDMKGKVDEMHEAMMQAAGGWRVLLAVGSVAAVIGAGVTKLLGVLWR